LAAVHSLFSVLGVYRLVGLCELLGLCCQGYEYSTRRRCDGPAHMSWYLLDPWRLVQSDFGRRGEEAEGIVNWASGRVNICSCPQPGPSEGLKPYFSSLKVPSPALPLPLSNRHQQVRQDSLFD